MEMLRIEVNANAVDKVGSCNDLLTEILLHLPVRSLVRFTSVSKNWYFIISSPRFKHLHSRNPNPPSGLFVPVIWIKQHLEYEFIPFDIRNPAIAPFRTLNFDPNVERIGIRHSCNGLMLCYSKRINKYYVYNPTINRFITLPRFEIYDNSYLCGERLI